MGKTYNDAFYGRVWTFNNGGRTILVDEDNEWKKLDVQWCKVTFRVFSVTDNSTNKKVKIPTAIWQGPMDKDCFRFDFTKVQTKAFSANTISEMGDGIDMLRDRDWKGFLSKLSHYTYLCI
jgi:hypothetical protein